jgi:MFS transporter, putative metabolite:H+ symporter
MESAMSRPASILARIDRLPPSRTLFTLVARIASGGWFEFYELFMPGFISVGLIRSHLFTPTTRGLLDFHSFSSFLASFFAGMFLSTILFGRISDRFGRRPIYIGAMLVYSLFNLFIAFSHSPGWIDCFRFVAGFAVGLQLINNDSFISELTPRVSRGRYMAFAFTFILTATPVAALLATLLVPHAPFGIAGWRIVVAIGAAGGVLVWFLQRGLPESPRWLEVHGRRAEADAVVSAIEEKIRAETGRQLPPPDPAIPDAVVERGRFLEVFGPFYLRRTVVISIFQFCQTIGVFGFTSWVPVFLAHRGIAIVHSLEYTFMIVLLTPFGGAIGLFLAERFERKYQLALAALIVGTFGFAFAAARSVPFILFTGAMIVLGNNWLTAIFHSYAAELFPTRIRAQAVGFTFSFSRIGAIFVSYMVAAVLASYGTTGVFTMIGLAMAAIVIAVGGFGPRTNGLALEVLSP